MNLSVYKCICMYVMYVHIYACMYICCVYPCMYVYCIYVYIFLCIFKKIFWPLFIKRVQLPQSRATARRQFTVGTKTQESLIIDWSTSKGWKTKSILERSSGFEPWNPGLVIQGHIPLYPLGHYSLSLSLSFYIYIDIDIYDIYIYDIYIYR